MANGVYWLASYPKSGNTWVRAFLSNYFAPGDAAVGINQLEYGFQGIKRSWIDEWLGFETADLPPDLMERYRAQALKQAAGLAEGPTFCKTHEIWREEAGSVAVGSVLIVRNPLDVAVSMAHYFNVDLDEAIRILGDERHVLARQERSVQDVIPVPIGSWSSHAQSWLESGHAHCLTRYEDLLEDPEKGFARILNFISEPIAPGRLKEAVERTSFGKLQAQEEEEGFSEKVTEAPSFFRAGASGGWSEVLTDAQIARIVEAHGPMMTRLGYDSGVS